MLSLKLISSVIEESKKWDMPVLVEPLLSRNTYSIQEKIELLTSANRVAFELGVDILKVSHPGDANVLKDWVGAFNIPIILLGGSKSGSTDDLLKNVKEAINAGIKGATIGRNIWQRPTEEAKDLLKSLAEIIHK